MSKRKSADEAAGSLTELTQPEFEFDAAESEIGQRRFAVCIFKDEVTFRTKRRLNRTWSEIRQMNEKHSLRLKKSGSMWGTYALKPKGGRYNAQVLHRSLVQIDIDTEGVKDKATGQIIEVTKAAPSLEDIRKKIVEFEWIATSSHWHEPSRGVHKYRLIFVPDRDIQPDEHHPLLEALDERLGGIMDRAAWALSQAFYLPSCPPQNESQAFFVHNSGMPLPVADLARRGREIITARESSQRSSVVEGSLPETPECIKYVSALLKFISADVDRATWMKVVFGIASLGWERGEDIAREWSETAPEKYDAGDFNGVWKSYDNTREKKVGFGTLVHIAKKYGAAVERPRLVFTGLGADIFNGRKFAELFRDRLLHVHETNQWLIFDPHQGWVVAPPGEAERSAKFVVKVLWDELADRAKRKL